MTGLIDPSREERRPLTPERTSSIRSRLCWLVAACVMPVWIVAGILVHHAYQAKRTQISGHMLEMARSLSMSVDRELAGVQAALTGLATSPSFEAGDLAAIHRQARMLLKSYPGADIIVADAGGQQLVNSRVPFGAPLPRRNTPETVRRIFRTGRPVVSDLFFGAVTGRPLVAIDVPVLRAGRVVYDLSMTFPPAPMAAIISQRRFSQEQRFGVILDSRGIVVARTREQERLLGRRACPELLGALSAYPEGGGEAVNLEGKRVLNAFSRSSLSGWVVVIGVPAATVQAEMQRWLGWALAGTLFLSLGGVGLAWSFGWTIARSIRSLAVPAETLGRGEPLDALARTGLEEVDAVGEALMHASALLCEHQAERDRSAAALRSSEAKLLRAQKIAQLGSWEWDPVSDQVIYTDEIYDIFGVDRERFGGSFASMLEDLIHPDDRELVRRSGERARLSGVGQTVEYRIIRPDGQERWIRAVGEFVHDPDGTARMVGANQDVTERKRAERDLREYARRLMDVEETLRKGIAAELHDETGRDLAVLGINLSIIADSLPSGAPPQLAARVGDSARLVESISRTVRNIMATLRPPMLDDYGLAAALRWYAQLFTQRTAIQVSLRVDEDFPRLDSEKEIVLFRIAQEALTNVAKYSGARQVVVALERVGKMLRFSVADDGRGLAREPLSPGRDTSGWGVLIMRERAELIGGVLGIESSPGQGVAVVVEFPGEGE